MVFLYIDFTQEGENKRMAYNIAQNTENPLSSKLTEAMEDEDTIFAKAFEKCLTDLANEVYHHESGRRPY